VRIAKEKMGGKKIAQVFQKPTKNRTMSFADLTGGGVNGLKGRGGIIYLKGRGINSIEAEGEGATEATASIR